MPVPYGTGIFICKKKAYVIQMCFLTTCYDIILVLRNIAFR